MNILCRVRCTAARQDFSRPIFCAFLPPRRAIRDAHSVGGISESDGFAEESTTRSALLWGEHVGGMCQLALFIVTRENDDIRNFIDFPRRNSNVTVILDE